MVKWNTDIMILSNTYSLQINAIRYGILERKVFSD